LAVQRPNRYRGQGRTQDGHEPRHYIGVSLLHAAFDSFGGIVGYIVISIIGIAPLVFLWWRVGGRKESGARDVQPTLVHESA